MLWLSPQRNYNDRREDKCKAYTIFHLENGLETILFPKLKHFDAFPLQKYRFFFSVLQNYQKLVLSNILFASILTQYLLEWPCVRLTLTEYVFIQSFRQGQEMT